VTRAKVPNRDFIVFIDGKLYKKLSMSKHENIIRCWDFEDKKIVAFVWTDFKRKAMKAYRISEVARMLNRNISSIYTAIWNEKFKTPHKITESPNAKVQGWGHGVYRFSDEDIINYHYYLVYETNGHGAMRKDGLPKKPRKPVPTKAELLAKLKGGTVLYARTTDGKFIPIWQEEAYL